VPPTTQGVYSLQVTRFILLYVCLRGHICPESLKRFHLRFLSPCAEHLPSTGVVLFSLLVPGGAPPAANPVCSFFRRGPRVRRLIAQSNIVCPPPVHYNSLRILTTAGPSAFSTCPPVEASLFFFRPRPAPALFCSHDKGLHVYSRRLAPDPAHPVLRSALRFFFD